MKGILACRQEVSFPSPKLARTKGDDLGRGALPSAQWGQQGSEMMPFLCPLSPVSISYKVWPHGRLIRICSNSAGVRSACSVVWKAVDKLLYTHVWSLDLVSRCVELWKVVSVARRRRRCHRGQPCQDSNTLKGQSGQRAHFRVGNERAWDA
jgi:hypothetical protein